MATSEAILAKMDESAKEAEKGLAKIAKQHPDAVVALGHWFQDNYQAAGYKRLARLVIDLAKE